MKKFAAVTVLIFTLIHLPIAALAQNTAESADPASTSAANVTVAEGYLAAYSTFKTEKMAPFLAKDAVFEDLTSTIQSAAGGPFVFSGKQAILDGLGAYAAQYQSFEVNYEVERRYESNGMVVFIAQLQYQLETKQGQTFSGTAPIVTVIGVRDGLVFKHLDFYDYNANAVNFTDR